MGRIRWFEGVVTGVDSVRCPELSSCVLKGSLILRSRLRFRPLISSAHWR
jgi:hypothetical protein